MVVIGEPTGVNSGRAQLVEARLAVYEAEKIPYSVEEQALFRLSQSAPDTDAATSRPAEPTPELMKAELHFRRGELSEAESAFKDAVEHGNTNAFALANLAATQVEQGKYAEAEANLNKALAMAPNDPFAHATMGLLRFQQGDYDQALDHLSLAAQYSPGNAKIQNYLGVTLSQKGMRGPAENALRKAIQLQPGFAQPHFNLALVYVLQEPPLHQLARWHYQQALAGGHERNTEVERLLEKAAQHTTQ
jgi:Flp pilus assembly protein TadD